LESKGITNGTCVRGVVDGEIHIPQKKSRGEENGTPAMGLKEHEFMQKIVHESGVEGLHSTVTPREADVVALQRWKAKNERICHGWFPNGHAIRSSL
jgi:hypothetical protein